MEETNYMQHGIRICKQLDKAFDEFDGIPIEVQCWYMGFVSGLANAYTELATPDVKNKELRKAIKRNLAEDMLQVCADILESEE